MPEYGGEGPLPFSTSDKVTESYIGVSIGLINRTPLERATENIPNHLHRGIVSYYSFVIGFVVTTTSLMAGALGLNRFREVYAVCYPSSYLTVMLGFCTWTRSAINGAR